MPNGKGIWANNFNHYYVGDINNNLQPLANYSELNVRFVRHSYATTFTVNQEIGYGESVSSQKISSIDNVFCVTVYVSTTGSSSDISKNDEVYIGYFGVSNDLFLYFNHSSGTTVACATYFNTANNLYAGTYDFSGSTSYPVIFGTQIDIFSQPIVTLTSRYGNTVNITSNIQYTIYTYIA